MIKKIIGIGFVVVITGLAITYFASGVIEQEKPIEKKRVSQLYRGHEMTRYSKSTIDLPISEYIFESVLQFDTVEHDFIFKNNSDLPLEIIKAEGCCGCSVSKYTSLIQPGLTGRISVLIITDRRGGTEINGTVRAVTNDKNNPEITINVFCPIKKIASISCHKIMLDGPLDKQIECSSIVIPEDDFPFKITGIKPKKGIDISYTYEEIEKDDHNGYLITVKRTRNKIGIFRDTLFIQTDNQKRPEFKIRVQGTASE